MHNPVWVYWESPKNEVEPAYITLCKWTMLHNWSDANIIFLSPQVIDSYIPGLSNKVTNIKHEFKGRLDRLQRLIKPDGKDLAMKCDAIRANFLNSYGGIYLDIGSIALNPISYYFELLSSNKDKNLLVSQRQSHNRSHYPVSFYGCKKGSPIIEKYSSKINQLIKNKSYFDYNALGTLCFTPIVRESIDQVIVLDEKDVMPITFEDAPKFYLSTELAIEDVIPSSTKLIHFKLFHGPFKSVLAQYSLYNLYHLDNFIGKLFRHALPTEAFNTYYNQWNNSN